MPSELGWVLLAFRMPREPSTPRIAVWRKLRRAGAVQVVDGLVALPADARTREQLEWIAEEVLEAGGEATVWLGRPATAGDERRLAARMSAAITEDYRAVLGDAQRALDTDTTARRRTLARLRRELQRISRRDYFPPPERVAARDSVERLAATLEEATP